MDQQKLRKFNLDEFMSIYGKQETEPTSSYTDKSGVEAAMVELTHSLCPPTTSYFLPETLSTDTASDGFSQDGDVVTVIDTEGDCGVLDDNLLEGTLENISHFPQLIKEVQRLKEERDKQIELDEKRKQAELVEIEKQQQLAAANMEREKRDRRQQALSDAHSVIEESELEVLKQHLNSLTQGNREMNVAIDKLSTELELAVKQCELLEDMPLELNSEFTSHGDSNRHPPPSAKVKHSPFYVEQQDILTIDGQERLMILANTRSHLHKQMSEVRSQIADLSLQRKSLIDEESCRSEMTYSDSKLLQLRECIKQLQKEKCRLQALLS